MKQYLLFTIIFLLTTNTINAQTTFSWETATIDNTSGTTTDESINGISVHVENSFSGNPANESNIGWTTHSAPENRILYTPLANYDTYTFTFDQAVDISTFEIGLEGSTSVTTNFTVSTSDGTNADVLSSIPPAGFFVRTFTNVTLNWTNVTSFTVTTDSQIQGVFNDLVITSISNQVVYVNANATGTNDGSSWTNAYTNLQTALDTEASATYLIAAGTYTPSTANADSRKATFDLPSETKIYGGFDGTETAISQRDPKTNITILSGDLNADDNTILLDTEATRQDNAYHVVSVRGNSQNVELHGLTITGGNANGTTDDSCSTPAANQYYDIRGGAIYANPYVSGQKVELDIKNCVIEKNTGSNVAVFATFTPCGVQNLTSDVNFESCVIKNNYSKDFVNVLYIGSSAYNILGEGSIINTVFYNNTSQNSTSALYLYASGTAGGNASGVQVPLINNTFTKNTGLNGNTISFYQAYSSWIKNCIIYGNGSATPLGLISSSGAAVNSIIEGGQQGGINSDPMFVSSATNNFHLQAGSPAIDAGDNSLWPADLTTDLDGNNRLINTIDMGAYEHNPTAGSFKTTWQTTTTNESITIPTEPTLTYAYDIDWDNDGVFDDTAVTGDATHTYATAGNHTINIRGTFPSIYFNDGGDKTKIMSIDQWGDIAWETMMFAFNGCTNLQNAATDAPDLSSVTNLSAMFFNCTSFMGDISSWDTSNVTDMAFMFYSASSFNADISNWSTNNVTRMRSMFYEASSFNAAIGSWNTTNVTDMKFMFYGATSFDQDLGTWNVENVTEFGEMFTNVTLSNANYDALLIGWDAQNLQPNMSFHGGNSEYCLTAAQAAHANMTNSGGDNWIITDGGACATLASFVTTWQTTTANESITIPTEPGLTYAYDIDWDNDGVFDDTAVTGDATHTYVTAGNHTISIRGTFPGIYFNNGGDKTKIMSIDQWGTIAWETMQFAFYGCTNLQYTATDAPNLSNVTSMYAMFANCTSFNGNISTWDTSSVNDMGIMFADCTSFDQDLGTWNVENVTDFSGMFVGVTLSSANYDALLIGWDAQNLQPNMSFHGGNSEYCSTAAQIAHTNMTSSGGDNWGITDGGTCYTIGSFVTTWQTTSANESILIPTKTGLTYSYDIDWDNDGVFEDTAVTGDATHSYATAGNHIVSIRGTFPSIYFNGVINSSKYKLIAINQWGNIAWQTMNYAFFGCINLQYAATDAPDLSAVTNMEAMFSAASSFNGDLSNWDTSNVTNMIAMFASASSFNGTISNWSTDNVTNMLHMFHGAISFNQDISSWNTASVADMNKMFRNATSFDQDLGAWNVENVTDFGDMFDNVTLSNANYDALLIGWDAQNLQPNMSFHGGNSEYCSTAAQTAHANMTSSGGDNWTITDGGACTALGIDSYEKDTSISLYPNPVHESLFIQSSYIIQNIRITDITGRVVKDQRILSNTTQENIKLATLTSGVYFVNVQSKKGQYTAKIIKQ